MCPIDRRVRIHQEEMERLLNLKSILDHKEEVLSYAKKYQKLGWVLEALNAQDGTNLEVDFGESSEIWIKRLWGPGLMGPKIKLGVSTGKSSQLMVLEVTKGRGESILDQNGEWRAECRAALGDGLEQHFYAWRPSSPLDSPSTWASSEIRWFGEGQMVLVPPSFEPEIPEVWRWLCPPWEKPPQYPSQALWRFLHQHISREPQAGPEVSLSWQEIYCLVSPYEPLLQALSASPASVENYYQGILEAAGEVGIKTPEVLLSLLWHAPRGNARQHPEIWDNLQKMVAQVRDDPGQVSSRGNVPFELFLDNAFSFIRETSAGSADQPGPQGFLKRHLANRTQPGAATRTPFSSCKTNGDSRKV